LKIADHFIKIGNKVCKKSGKVT